MVCLDQNGHPKKWIIWATVSVGTFMSTLDGGIVNVALPFIREQFNVSIESLQWVVTAYLLTISSLLLLFGRLADLFGRRKIFSFGFIVFIIGSALCSLAVNLETLVIFRIIQAVGSAMLMANGMGIISTSFPPHQRGRALGMGGTVVALGSLAGPAIGGILVRYLGWPSIFYLNLPIGILGFIAAVTFIPQNQVSEKPHFDILGAVSFSFSIISFLYGLNISEQFGWLSLHTLLFLISGLLAFVFFIYWEKRHPSPIMDLSLFKNRIFLFGNLAGLISFIAMFFTTILMPFYLKDVKGISDARSIGLIMMAFPVMMAMVAPVSGWLSDKIGAIILSGVGLSVVTVGLILLSNINATTPFWWIYVNMSMFGIGMGLFQSPNNSAVMGAVPPQKAGIAGGVNATMRNVGMVTGIAISVTIFTQLRSHYLLGIVNPTAVQKATAFSNSIDKVFLIAAGISALGIVFSLIRGKGNVHAQPAESRK